MAAEVSVTSLGGGVEALPDFETILKGIGTVVVDDSDYEEEQGDTESTCSSSDDNGLDKNVDQDNVPSSGESDSEEEDGNLSPKILKQFEALRVHVLNEGEDDEDLDEGVYVAKGGPIKGSDLASRHTTSSHPYKRHDHGANRHLNLPLEHQVTAASPIGEFVESREELELEGLLNGPKGIPGLPSCVEASELEQTKLLSDIDDIFKEKDESLQGDQHPDYNVSKSRFILKTVSSETCRSTCVNADFSMIVDCVNKCVGIRVPQTVIPPDCIPTDAAMTEAMDTYIQMDRRNSKIIKFKAAIEEIQEKWVIKSQVLKMKPFAEEYNGVKSFLESLSTEELQKGISRINSKADTDIFKITEEGSTLLHCLVVSNRSTGSEVVALVKRILASSDPEKRSHILKKDMNGLNAFHYAAIAKKLPEAKFLAEINHYFGADLMTPIADGNSILHTLARLGDETAEIFEALLSLRFSNGLGAFPLDVPNNKGELPIHIVAQLKKCSQFLLSLMHSHWPENTTAKTLRDGMTPLHLACQYGYDPTTLALLIYYNKETLNQRRFDGLTPLHLVACRSNVQKKHLGLVKLDEQTQLRMIGILLEHGADKFSEVNGLAPMDLVHSERPRVRERLWIKRSPTSSRTDSPVTGSPDSYNNFGGLEVPFSPQNASSPLSVDTAVTTDSMGNQFSPLNINSGSSVTSGFESDSSHSDRDLDTIASILYQQHPLIQQVVSENLADFNPQ